MKNILIFRHAKSDWSDVSLPDFERPLTKRGRKDASRMGKLLAKVKLKPEVILASPAERAKETASLAGREFGGDKRIIWEPDFYHGDESDIVAVLRTLPPAIDCAMIIGHNPTLTDLVTTLCQPDADNTIDFVRLPTAGLVNIEVDITDWASLRTGYGLTRWFVIPKLIKSLL